MATSGSLIDQQFTSSAELGTLYDPQFGNSYPAPQVAQLYAGYSGLKTPIDAMFLTTGVHSVRAALAVPFGRTTAWRFFPMRWGKSRFLAFEWPEGS